MTRIIKATLLAALLALGCSGDPEDIGTTMATPHGEVTIIGRGLNNQGEEIDCTALEPGEGKFTGHDGYDPAGCSRTERMWNVRPWRDDDDGWGPETDGDFAQLEQPITVHGGTDAATKIFVNGSQQITGFGGNCPVDFTWTTARPVIANCLIPDTPSAIDWAVCPDCYSSANLNYMKARMSEAWDVWRRQPTVADCAGVNRTTSVKATSNSQETSFSTPNENYDNAKIVVYPVTGISAQFPGARMGIDKDFLTARTPIRNGIRYYSWSFAALEVDHSVIENVKLPDCVSATDVNRLSKLASAYTFILAHELGHAWGMPHLTTGLMRRGSMQQCSDVFNVDINVARNMPSGFERIVFANLKDSSGFSVSADTASCGAGSITSDSPDDLKVVNF
jgi:hypothetical protein